MTYSELREKHVINIRDGADLGKPFDLILNESACIEALVVPADGRGLLSLLRQNREGCAIDWRRVRRIGSDVILVEVDSDRFSDGGGA